MVDHVGVRSRGVCRGDPLAQDLLGLRLDLEGEVAQGSGVDVGLELLLVLGVGELEEGERAAGGQAAEGMVER
ncbi:hypothetical protein [Streptomyces sp. NPDC087300]|uniref:hypothetical protein n=1 Tax=Streptomyces sp. NPDC087300 TaxID=3365780 RepID=UPI00380DC49D